MVWVRCWQMRDAMWRYAKENGPCTIDRLMAEPTLLNGVKIRNHPTCAPKSRQQVANLLRIDSRFGIMGHVESLSMRSRGKVALWGVVPDEESDRD